MITACFACALQRCPGRLYTEFRFIFQAVRPIGKTRNQLVVTTNKPKMLRGLGQKGTVAGTGSVPVTGTKIIQYHKCLGGTRKLSNSSIVHTWSVSPAAMAGVTGFHFFREPFRPLVGRLWGRRCRKLRWGTTK